MLDGTDPETFLEWYEYSLIEPFGYERGDLRNAILCMFIADSLGVKKKGGGKFKIEDFIPKFDVKEKGPLDPDLFKRLMKKHYGNNRKSVSKSNRPDRKLRQGVP